MYTLKDYKKLKHELLIAKLCKSSSIKDLEEQLQTLINDLHENSEIKFCEACGCPLDADDRCYNVDCEEYDPIGQYFDQSE